MARRNARMIKRNASLSPPPVPGRGAGGVNILSQEKSALEKNPHIHKNQTPPCDGKDPKSKEDKSPINKQNQNLKIASLNTQGRKLEECINYMEKANIDILCVQESKIPSNSCFSIKKTTYASQAQI